MNHIIEQMNKSREEFDKLFPQEYLHVDEKVLSFLISAQLDILKAAKEEVGAKQEYVSFGNLSFDKHDGIQEERNRIRHIFDEAINEANKDI